MQADPPSCGLVRAIYTGRKREALINGRREPTAYLRARREGPLRLGREGLAGDTLGTARRLGRENHAVYLFAERHYAHFEAVLGRPIPRGAFSENILYEGPDETELRIGDRLRIGSALVELVSPRVPCYKLAHFLGTEPGFPSRFSASGRTGVYGRVIEPGSLSAGSALARLESDARNATLAELNEVLTAGRPGADALSRVMASPALLPALRQVVEERMDNLSLPAAAMAQTVRIAERVQETPDVISLSFEMALAPGERPKPGQFVTFGITDDAGRQHFRCYSLTDGPFPGRDGRACRISVKREAKDGKEADAFSVSSWLHEHIGVGAECSAYPPAGAFCLPEGLSGPLAFYAGGIGITPVFAQIRALAEARYPDPVTLIYVSRSVEELAFLGELSDLAERWDRFALRLFVTGAETPSAELPAPIRKGRPDLEREVAAMDGSTHVFVCGPLAMIEAVRTAHAALGRANDRLHFELFSDAAILDESMEPAPRAEITIAPEAYRAAWRPGDGSLLAWIERHTDHRPPAACRSGICRTCAAPLLRGQVVYPATVAPPPSTEVLLCCAMPATDVEIGLAGDLLGKAVG